MNTRLPDIVLFDLDGTLIDSVPDIATAVNAMRTSFGMPEVPVARVRSWVGRGLSTLMHRALTDDDDGVADPGDHEESIRVFRGHYRRCCAQHTSVFDGGEDMLSWLAASPIKVAIVTNKPTSFAAQIAKTLGIDRHLDVLLGAESHRPLKPDPSPLREAVDHLGGGSAWMVGDTRFDRAAAIAAGIPFIGVQLEGDQGRNIADIVDSDEPVFSSLRDLHDWLRVRLD
jgi:phosphoglycolate phosphatase